MHPRCECCGTDIAYTECYCMIEALCAGCNHCVAHCKCVQPVETAPYPMQLQQARAAWREMGVLI